MKARKVASLLLAVLAVSLPARAETTLSADAYRDKLYGMWMGEMIGNYAGRPVEGYTARGGLGYAVNWSGATTTATWDGDDDTCFELLNSDILNANPDPNSAQIGQEWGTHIAADSFYIANRQARGLMTRGVTPPQTGSITSNIHWSAIDSQITTESLGGLAPGDRQRAADLAGRFGSVTNDGFAVHAAQFYAAMYSAAATDSDIESVVDKGLAVVPHTSRTYQIITDVRDWYQQDKADGLLDWRATQTKVYDKYCGSGSFGRYGGWIESSVNTAMTTLAVLYGQGDFKKTVEIGVGAGFDADCNPATAGGLVGMIKGYSGLPSDLTSQCGPNYQADSSLRNMQTLRTIPAIIDGLQQATEQQIVLAGGSVTGSGASRIYHLPEDVVAAPLEKPDPTGPKGLVGQWRARGGTVSVSASVEKRNAAIDADNLDGIIDGITDVTYNGHRAYSTYDSNSTQPAGGDFYQLNFSQSVVFDKVVFYEGDYAYGNINAWPWADAARGGFFTNLTVEVRSGGVFRPAGHLQLSEALDSNSPYQTLEMLFDPAFGDAVRIRGAAGGSQEFTTILELEAYGAITLPGDCNLDGVVGTGDLALMAGHWSATDANWYQGDFNGDGVVGTGDLALMAGNWNWSNSAAPPAGNPVPEPASFALMLAGAAWAASRRRERSDAMHP
ncbi:MAG: ADP-ribosylglycohydrolase family protein [Phycisphaerae bacterium]